MKIYVVSLVEKWLLFFVPLASCCLYLIYLFDTTRFVEGVRAYVTQTWLIRQRGLLSFVVTHNMCLLPEGIAILMRMPYGDGHY